MNRRIISIVMVVAACACVWAAGGRNAPLMEMRARHRLVAVRPLENAPPLMAFTTVVMGGFRGIIVDVLWLRVSALQEKGEYFEIVQLADWIAKLEPRCGEIMRFHAWNMAYNISVMMPEPEDRWRWIKNSIRLLHDEGLRYDPSDPSIYWEIGWIYQHKVGGTTDRAERYYKVKLAEGITSILGSGRADYAAIESKPETAERLEKEYGLVPAVMKEVESRYGPLDWRIPEAHSVYWGYRGKQKARKDEMMPCLRMVYQSMMRLFEAGKLSFDPGRNEYAVSMDPSLFEAVTRSFEDALAEYPGEESFAVSYGNFLKDAVRVFHTLNRDEDAAKTYEIYRTKVPKDRLESFEQVISRPKSQIMF